MWTQEAIARLGRRKIVVGPRVAVRRVVPRGNILAVRLVVARRVGPVPARGPRAECALRKTVLNRTVDRLQPAVALAFAVVRFAARRARTTLAHELGRGR